MTSQLRLILLTCLSFFSRDWIRCSLRIESTSGKVAESGEKTKVTLDLSTDNGAYNPYHRGWYKDAGAY